MQVHQKGGKLQQQQRHTSYAAGSQTSDNRRWRARATYAPERNRSRACRNFPKSRTKCGPCHAARLLGNEAQRMVREQPPHTTGSAVSEAHSNTQLSSRPCPLSCSGVPQYKRLLWEYKAHAVKLAKTQIGNVCILDTLSEPRQQTHMPQTLPWFARMRAGGSPTRERSSPRSLSAVSTVYPSATIRVLPRPW